MTPSLVPAGLSWRIENGYGRSTCGRYYVLRCERDAGPRGGKRWLWSWGLVVGRDQMNEGDYMTRRDCIEAANAHAAKNPALLVTTPRDGA